MRTLPTREWIPQILVRDQGGGSPSGHPGRRRPVRGAVLAGFVLLVVAGLGSLVPAGGAGAQEAPVTAAPTTTALAVNDQGTTPGSPAPAPAAAPGTTATGGVPVAGSAGPGFVSVVTLTGLIDPIIADFMNRSLDEAERAGARALIFQTDLDGSVIPDDELAGLIGRMRTSRVPVAVWIGPTGASLTGKAAFLALGARAVAMAPGTTVGDAPSLTEPLDLSPFATGDTRDPTDVRLAAIRAGALDAEQARAAGVTNVDAPTLGDFYIALPGIEVRTVVQGDTTRREPVTQAVFSQLSLLSGFMHSAASPAVAYLLLAVGLSLLIFELFTAGVGVAGVVGAGAFVLSCYGLAVLPTRWWALTFLVLSMVAFAVDVQTGVPRFWTGTGLVLFTLGSLGLYDGVSMSWVTIVVGILAVALAFLAGMPSMVRTRFSTPTIGREWMIGELGRAITDIAPDGVVQIKGAPWRAYTNRATPIEQLDKVRVIGIEGLVLEVEPEEGGARDYRERRGASDRAR